MTDALTGALTSALTGALTSALTGELTGASILPWIGYAVLLASCVALAAAALEAMAAAQRRARRAPWVLALGLAMTIPLLVALRPSSKTDQPPHIEPLASPAVSSARATAAQQSLDRWTIILWGLASATLLARIAAGALQLRRAVRRSIVTEVDGVAVALTDATGPGARCFGSPRILVPARLLTLEPNRRAMLLRHEFEHVRGGDPFLLLATLVATATMPWNPALWFIARRLREALELDCDSRVLAATGDARDYGELLLTVAAGPTSSRFSPYLPFASPPSTLERRIRAISAPRAPLGALRYGALAVVIVGASVSACVARRPAPIASLVALRAMAATDAPTVRGAATEDATRRRELERALRETVPASILDANASEPLLVTYTADGRLVYAMRMPPGAPGIAPAKEAFPFRESDIASVDVDKSPTRLPPPVRGGIVRIVLKAHVAPPRDR